MLKNMKIGTKLILFGSLIMLVPLVIVAFFSVTKSTEGLENLENEQMAARAEEIALVIDKVFVEEKKLVLAMSARSEVIAAVGAVAEKGIDNAGEEIAVLNRIMEGFIKTTGLGDDSQVIFCTSLNGMTFASSHEDYIGVSFSDRPSADQYLWLCRVFI